MFTTEVSTVSAHVEFLGSTVHDALVQLERMERREAYSLEPVRIARVMFDLIEGDLPALGHRVGEGETTVALESIRLLLIRDGGRFDGSAVDGVSLVHIASSFSSRMDMVLLLQPCPGNQILTSLITDLRLIESAAARLGHARR